MRKLAEFTPEARSIVAQSGFMEAVNAHDLPKIATFLAPHFGNERVLDFDLEFLISDASAEEKITYIKDLAIQRDDRLKHFPKMAQRWATNYYNIDVVSIHRLAACLVEELAYGNTPPYKETDVQNVVAKQLMSFDFFKELHAPELHRKILVDESHEEVERNRDNLQVLSGILAKEAERAGLDVDTDATRLLRYQSMLMQVNTSSEMIISDDFNYREQANKLRTKQSSFNGSPSLFGFPYTAANPDYAIDYYLHDLGHLPKFVNPVTAYEVAGLQGTFGFLRVFRKGEDGTPYVRESNIVMVDNRIMGINHPLIEKIVDFDKTFPMDHDMFHNLIPLYSRRIYVNPNTNSPMRMNGVPQGYETFGDKTRGYPDPVGGIGPGDVIDINNEYEMSLGAMQAKLWQTIREEQPDRWSAIVADFEETLRQVKEVGEYVAATESAEFAKNFTKFFAVIYFHRAMNIIAPNDPDLDKAKEILNSLDFETATVLPIEVYQLLQRQGVMAIPEEEKKQLAIRIKEADTSLEGADDFELLMAQAPQEIVAEVLEDKYLDFTLPDKIAGAEHLVEGLKSIGAFPLNGKTSLELDKFGTVRFEGYRIESDEDGYNFKGFRDKIHNRDTILFGYEGGEYVSHPVFMMPLLQAQAISEDMELLQKRMMVNWLVYDLLGSVSNLLPFGTTPNTAIASAIDTQADTNGLAKTLDDVVESLCTFSFDELSANEAGLEPPPLAAVQQAIDEYRSLREVMTRREHMLDR